MKSARSKQLKKGSSKSRSGSLTQDPVEVVCRIRPVKSGISTCLKAISSTTVQFSSPEGVTSYRNGTTKELQCTFKEVFDEDASQKEVFEKVAHHLVNQLVAGKNGLLFTYGVTGSGKTYTMTGEANNPGIMPRCLDVIFNSIGKYQAPKYVFKPDRMNGFEIVDQDEAALAHQNEILGYAVPKTPKTPRRREGEGDVFFARDPQSCDSVPVDEDNQYSCFVTYIEIYNNSVFDLLDSEDSITRKLQNKVIREDGNRNMYVHGVTEVEIKSPEEAFELFARGQRKKRVAQTLLNAESSRSHSVFTIRLVQAPLDEISENALQRKLMTVSQLSLVDLAGSERTNRTKNTGLRLREAGSINNSLMTLRTCLEILRENQQCGSNKMVPYRDSKLTHLFKNYFDGEGAVRMIVCVNPRSDDFDETAQVLKFAEMTQEVQITRPTPVRFDVGLTPGRRRVNKRELDIPIDSACIRGSLPLLPPFPSLTVLGYNDEETFRVLEEYLQQRMTARSSAICDLAIAEEALRKELINVESTCSSSKQETAELRAQLDLERRKFTDVDDRVVILNSEKYDLLQKISDRDVVVRSHLSKIDEQELLIKQLRVEKEKLKEKCNNKLETNKEKYRRVCNTRKGEIEEMQDKLRLNDEKIRQVKEVLGDATRMTPRPPRRDIIMATPRSVNTHGTLYQPNNAVASTPRGPAVSNPRRRRSRSAGGDDHWLDHRPAQPVELGTVFQPNMRKRKSVTKLTDVKDVVNSKTSKYCLTTQEQDTDGELETKLYKGDVIPTCTGGAQVILHDVEMLKQKSPTAVTHKKRSLPDERTEDRCKISVEGHGKRLRS